MEPYIIISIFVALLLWILDRSALSDKKDQIQKQLEVANKEKSNLYQQLKVANAKVTKLSPYEAIVDAEAAAKQITLDARIEADTTRAESRRIAANVIATAKEEAKTLRASAKDTKDKALAYLENQTVKADVIWQQAMEKSQTLTEVANQVLEDARKKAIEVAGNAYLSMEDAQAWEQKAKAFKNIVDGYGSKYIRPAFSLLDDLAQEFGHTEAGQQLAAARERTRLMIEAGIAASCEYAEPQRRDTANKFVLDAFNGKVDSILSKVKKDNIGTLTQMIEDAYTVVNANGKAFRNAIISLQYKEARLEELKWAVISQELKWQEQEEQRRIKEQIREEEKARRDFERALKEAAKEEDILKKLIEKAQKQVADANEAQRAEYELKLEALEGRLKEAEEKNQRALSMAQQTKSGNVYIISNIGSFGEDVFKIGMTRRLDPLDRIRELGDASVPFEFDVHAMIYSEDAPALERQLHKQFLRMQMNKVNPRKEFFKIGLGDIKEAIEQQGIEVRWTLTADAKQYRESLAIAEAIAKGSEEAKAWEEAQLKVDPVSIELEELSGESFSSN